MCKIWQGKFSRSKTLNVYLIKFSFLSIWCRWIFSCLLALIFPLFKAFHALCYLHIRLLISFLIDLLYFLYYEPINDSFTMLTCNFFFSQLILCRCVVPLGSGHLNFAPIPTRNRVPSVYSFPRAAITRYHNQRWGVKQEKFLVL